MGFEPGDLKINRYGLNDFGIRFRHRLLVVVLPFMVLAPNHPAAPPRGPAGDGARVGVPSRRRAEPPGRPAARGPARSNAPAFKRALPIRAAGPGWTKAAFGQDTRRGPRRQGSELDGGVMESEIRTDMDQAEAEGNIQGGADGAERERRIERAKAALAGRFHIEAEFVGVPTLARAIGLAASTVYGLIRAGTFCIPHRVVGSTVLVSLDDLAEWHCFGSVAAPAPSPEMAGVRRRAKAAASEPIAEPEQSVDEIVAEALRSMGLQPKPRRAARATRR